MKAYVVRCTIDNKFLGSRGRWVDESKAKIWFKISSLKSSITTTIKYSSYALENSKSYSYLDKIRKESEKTISRLRESTILEFDLLVPSKVYKLSETHKRWLENEE